MKFSKEQSSQLATVTFVATVLVVMCHCDDVMPNKDGLVRFLGGIFTDANVANFFFLSGFFVACHFGEKGWYLRAIGKRLRTLGTPYLGWCFIYVFGYAFLHRLGIYHPFKNILDVREAFGIGFLTHPVDFALWYIKTLFYFILAAPLFFRLQSRYRFAFPLCAILLLRFSLTSFGGSPYFGFCFNLIGFISFLMGAEMAFCEPIREAFLRPNRAKMLTGAA